MLPQPSDPIPPVDDPVATLSSELADLIAHRRFEPLKARLAAGQVADVADAIDRLPPEQEAVAFRLLDKGRAGDVFEYLSFDAQEHLLHTLSDADAATVLEATVNGQRFCVPLRDLSEGDRTHHLGGFVSPAIAFHRAVPESEYAVRFDLPHRTGAVDTDAYRVRVRQRNDQWAWSSPVWVEPGAPRRR